MALFSYPPTLTQFLTFPSLDTGMFVDDRACGGAYWCNLGCNSWLSAPWWVWFLLLCRLTVLNCCLNKLPIFGYENKTLYSNSII